MKDIITIDDDIAEIQKHDLGTLDRWEIAVVPDPISTAAFGKERALPLTLIVHQESGFIFTAHIISPDDTDGCAGVLIGIIKKHGALPEVLVMRDHALADELKPITEKLGIKTEVLKRLTAVPEVLRAMTLLSRKQ